MKVLFQADLGSVPLARMATGLANAFVLQAPGSHLLQMRHHVAAGFAFEGPALFSVLSGVVPDVNVLPPYLVAAAALESRAFPAFAYDPAATGEWSSRVDLSMNPQPDRDWPAHRVDYEDRQHQRVSVDVAFTFVDFAACDRRYARHLALVPQSGLTEGLLPVSDWLAAEPVRQPLAVPSLLMIDRDHRLQRVLADETILRDARQCRDRWRSLQDFGRIHDAQVSRPAETAPTTAVAESAPALPADEPSTPAVPEAAASSDEPCIETPRCSTCNECIQINNRMFAYNGNRQAYIADARAGTYQQLVEAAESCQVSIIHPGKPLNPSEPGLAELIARAQPFQ
jgi:hypothetical protein